MPTPLTCPDVALLKQLVLGQLPAEEITSLQEHLAQCPDCLATVGDLPTDDPLLRAMQAPPPAPAPEDEAVERLMERLRGLGAPPATPGDAETLAADPAAAAAAADTPADIGSASYDFLSAAQGEGELGRLGPYRVLRVLGQGGMGIVFEAEDSQLQRHVGLKVMKPNMACHPEARHRFLREARATAAIEHDHIVTIHHVGEDRNTPYLAMQLLRGETLERRLQRDGRLPAAEVVRIGREIAEGLAAAHARRLIHRDIKPANIWLETGEVVSGAVVSGESSGPTAPHSPLTTHPSPRVKILDFGLARAAAESAQLTQTGIVAGTPAYMAPEQASDAPIDQRCDLFSLGCVLYRLSTGELPFKGAKPLTILWALAVKQPAPPRQLNAEVPPALSQLILRLLAKNPDDRPQTAREVAETLRTIEHDLAGAASPAPRSRRPVALAAAVLLTVLLGAAAYQYGPAVYRLVTNQGQLVIETDDPDVKVVVKQEEQEVTIMDAKTKQEVTLKAGKYQIELVSPKMDLQLATKELTLARGGRQIVQVRWLPPGPVHTLVNPGAVWGAQFCLDGSHVIAAPGNLWEKPLWKVGSDFALRLWDAKTGLEVKQLKDHTQIVRGLAVSPDGRRVVSVSGHHPKADPADWTVRLWDLETGKLIRRFRGHTSPVLAVAFSADGKRVVSGSDDKSVRLWDVETGEELRRFEKGETTGVWSVAISRDGKRILSGNLAGLTRLWNAETGKEIHSLRTASAKVGSVSFSPDGRLCLTEGRGSDFGLWDLETRQVVQRFHHPWGWVGYLAFSPDGRRILSGGEDRIVRLWDAATGKELYRFEGHTEPVTTVAFSPDGRFAVSGSWEKTVRIWKLPE